MVRLRSKPQNEKQSSGGEPPGRGKRKLPEKDASSSSINLRSSKRVRTTRLPYQTPDSASIITKLSPKRKQSNTNEKTPGKRTGANTTTPKRPAKVLKRLNTSSLRSKNEAAKKPSVRRKILKSPEPTRKVKRGKLERVTSIVKKAKTKSSVKTTRNTKASRVTPVPISDSATPTGKSKRTRKTDIKTSSKSKTDSGSSLKPKNGTGAVKEKKRKKGKLNPKPELTNYEVDPTFESKLEIPFISTLAHSRLIIRAVIMNDMRLLKKLVQDEPNKIFTLKMFRNSKDDSNAIDYILKTENKEALKFLHKLSPKLFEKFGDCPQLLLSREQTGHGSTMMFGHAMKQVSVGRGGKEGNDAFLYDSKHYHLANSPNFGQETIQRALKIGTSKSFVEFLAEYLSIHSWNFTEIYVPLRMGHRELAGYCIGKAMQRGGYGFNFLHEEVLTRDSASDLTSFKPVSVIKKCTYEPRFTPLHCAAINPNVEVLAALMKAMPDYNLADQQGWTVGHYAAVCSGPEPLKYLLQFGISTQAVTSAKRNGEKYTLLHAAISAGRAHNVKVILEHEEKVAKENPSPMDLDEASTSAKKKPSKALLQNDIKYKFNSEGYGPLHMACHLGHLEIVRILLEAGVDAEIPTPAKFDRVTPLMIATMHGNLDIVKTLVEAGVKVEAKDKRGRTAAHYAAMNGHTHILSYLLRLGVNHLAEDTSGNTLLHYSAAYGWYFATMLCLEAGCPPNATNFWKLTPMAVAFMKGHIGLVTVLIKKDGVDVNARIDDSTGRTLLHDVCVAGSDLKRLKFLIEDLGADSTCEDFNGNNALHFLVGNEPRDHQENFNKLLDAYKSCISYLIEKGCDPFKKNVDGTTPFLLAAKQSKFHFIAKLLELKIQIPYMADSENNTMLHHMTHHFLNLNSIVYVIFSKLCNDPKGLEVMKEMASTSNKSGQTPLLSLLHGYLTIANEELKEKVRQVVETFFDKLDAKVDAKGTDEKTALHLTVGTFLLPTILKYSPSLNVVDGNSQTPLVIAVLGGHQQDAERLIDAEADVKFRFKSEHNISLLLYSVMKESTSFTLIPKLIAKGADAHEIHPKTKNSILHYISRNPGSPNALQALQAALDCGVNPNLQNCDGRTPMHLVVNARGTETDVFYDIEDSLISAGANLAVKDFRGRIPLHYAFVKIGKPTESTFFDPIELVSHLVTAMKSSGAAAKIHTQDVFGSTPLHYAAFRGATICSSFLIQTLPSHESSIDICDNNGNTPFGLAVRNQHEGCALNFYQKEADFLRTLNNNITVQEIRTEESTVLNSGNTKATVKRGPWLWEHLEKIKEEEDRMKEEEQKYPILEQVVKHDWQGLLYLMIGQLQSSGVGFSTGVATALKTRRFKLAFKVLLKVKRKQDLNLESGTLFHTLAKYYNGDEEDLIVKICDQFRKIGLDPAVRDEFESQPVIYALINQQTSLCSIVLKNEKDLMKRMAQMRPDLFGRTPFTSLFWNLETPMVGSLSLQNFAAQLISAGADPNQLTEFPIELSHFAGVRYTRKLTNIVPSDGSRYPPLILAVIHRCYSTVKWMLTAKTAGPYEINVNVQDSHGRTALMHAVRLNDYKMVKLILDPIKYNVFEDVHGIKEIRVKSSKGDPRITDKHGWTVMDYLLLSPRNNCYHKNVHPILKLLHQIGSLSITSGDGIKPIERAAKIHRGDLVELMAKLASLPPSKRPFVNEDVSIVFPSTPNQDVGHSPILDFHKDAEIMSRKLMEKALAKLKEKGEDSEIKTLPDPLSGMDTENAEVMIDKEQNIPYDCIMTKVDINYGIHGLYNFYKMQLIKQPRGKEMIVLFTQWGRVGQQGQYQKTPFGSEEEAIKEFTKIFKAKSGNAWDNVKEFTPIPTKYRLVKKDLRKVKHAAICDVEFEEITKYGKEKTSTAARSTLNLLRKLSMVHHKPGDNFEKKYRYHGFSTGPSYDNLPLLPIEILREGEEILKEIWEKIKLKELMEKDFSGKYLEKDKLEVWNDIAKLSENFYEIIPVYGYSTEKLEPIFFDHDLREKIVAISRLIHLELAKSLLLAAQLHQERMNPWEYIYRCLGTRIQLLDRDKPGDEEEANIVLQYAYNTGDNPKIMAIYRVEREEESERLNNCGVQNRQLLWHGTSAANMLAILKQGLQVAPLGSQISGHLFGKGVYLADCFAKSQNYCRTVGVDGKYKKFMLLCEAALGRIYEVELHEAGEKPMPTGYNSLKTAKSTYEPDPESTVLWRGRTVALGKKKERYFPGCENYYGLDHNEYVVFNENQIAIRYLIEFEG